jgi:hemerythrin-like domain-containing protein
MSTRIIPEDYLKAGLAETSAVDLQELAASEIMVVRRRVAENERTPVEVLSTLAKDKAAEVRMAVASNKVTPSSLLVHLVCDASPDVRYWMASTSYIPKHLLRQLADDENPHVAQRAKAMLAGLESKVGRMFTVFEFLSEDHNMLASQAGILSENYSKWTRDKVFEETVNLMDGIRRHLERQRRLCHDWSESSSDSELMQNVLRRSIAEHEKILDRNSDLLMQHVDGPDFLERVKLLLQQIRELIDFSENELFSVMKKHVSREELDAMNLRLNQSLLRGRPQ